MQTFPINGGFGDGLLLQPVLFICSLFAANIIIIMIIIVDRHVVIMLQTHTHSTHTRHIRPLNASCINHFLSTFASMVHQALLSTACIFRLTLLLYDGLFRSLCLSAAASRIVTKRCKIGLLCAYKSNMNVYRPLVPSLHFRTFFDHIVHPNTEAWEAGCEIDVHIVKVNLRPNCGRW